jgi:hypothetical protein
MDEKNLQFLKLMREQVRGKNSREVHSGQAARDLRMAPGSMRHSQYEVRVSDLVRDGYLEPHPERTPTDYQRYLTTDKGIATADEQEPRSSTGGPQEASEPLRDTTEVPIRRPVTRPWWRRVFGR